jgi:hypothetical protein
MCEPEVDALSNAALPSCSILPAKQAPIQVSLRSRRAQVLPFA